MAFRDDFDSNEHSIPSAPDGMPPAPGGMPPAPGGMPPAPGGMPPAPSGMPPVPGDVAIPAFPSVDLVRINSVYYWIIGADRSRGWDGMRWVTL